MPQAKKSPSTKAGKKKASDSDVVNALRRLESAICDVVSMIIVVNDRLETLFENDDRELSGLPDTYYVSKAQAEVHVFAAIHAEVLAKRLKRQFYEALDGVEPASLL